MRTILPSRQRMQRLPMTQNTTSTPSTPNRQGRDIGRCPVIHTDYRIERPAFEALRLVAQELADTPLAWNDSTDEGYWVVSGYDAVKELLDRDDEFTNDQVSAFIRLDPLVLLPQQLNQPEHAELRRVINPFFSPAAVRRISDRARERARELVTEAAPKKSIDMAYGFAMLYPTEMFMEVIGLPSADGGMFLPWVEDMFRGFFYDDEESLRLSSAAVAKINDYFDAVIDDRMVSPRDPETDLVTRLLASSFRGEPMDRDMVRTIATTLMAAGLDTTRTVLGYTFQHLARHPAERALLVEQPELWPKAIEEMIRLYPILLSDAREAAQDVDFMGLPIKKGDLVLASVTSANLDPEMFANPTEFDMFRPNVNRHLGFGAGHHRCLGLHLARAELIIALEEWHAQIPDYRIPPGVELRERGGQLRLQSLPLEWD